MSFASFIYMQIESLTLLTLNYYNLTVKTYRILTNDFKSFIPRILISYNIFRTSGSLNASESSYEQKLTEKLLRFSYTWIFKLQQQFNKANEFEGKFFQVTNWKV